MSTAAGFAAPGSEELQLGGANASVDLQPIALALLRSKFLIFSCGVIAAFLVWLLMLRLPATFLATTEILPPAIARGSNVSALLSQASASGDAANVGIGSILQAKNSSESFLVILSAWPIQDGIVQRFNLVKAYNAHDAAQARAILGARTVLKATREGFITIGIIDTDRTRAADISNAYVDQARQFLRGLALSEASQRRLFYEGQLAKTREDLTQAEVFLQHLQQKSGMVSLDSQARALLESAANLRAQITAKQVQLQSLRSYSTESNPQVQIQESELNALQGQLSQLESQGQGGYSGKSLSSVPGAEVEFVRATRELKYQEGSLRPHGQAVRRLPHRRSPGCSRHPGHRTRAGPGQ